MKTFKELVEALTNDEEFAQELHKSISDKCQADGLSQDDALIAAAKEAGYEITEEQLAEYRKDQSDVLTEEELGKVSGGFTLILLTTCIITTGGASAGAYELKKHWNDIFG